MHYVLQVLREERVIGTVTSEVSAGETQGRITYENKGECFFLPFSKDDVEGNVTLRSNDQVSFQIATNNKYVLRITDYLGGRLPFLLVGCYLLKNFIDP